MVVTCSGFTGATAVTFGTVAAAGFTVNSSTQSTVTAPAHIQDTVNITVTTPSGLALHVATDEFTYVSRPKVTAASPSSGPAAGGTTVTITGTRVTGTTAVTFGTVPARSFTVISATEITAVSPKTLRGDREHHGGHPPAE